jgi:hypothetical protein
MMLYPSEKPVLTSPRYRGMQWRHSLRLDDLGLVAVNILSWWKESSYVWCPLVVRCNPLLVAVST